jgi:hypothetical protein
MKSCAKPVPNVANTVAKTGERPAISHHLPLPQRALLTGGLAFKGGDAANDRLQTAISLS